MNYNCTYNDKIGDLASSALTSAATSAQVFASGGTDIAADIAAIVAQVNLYADLWTQWTSHPAADAKDFIKNAKPNIVNIDPYDRIVKVIGYSQRINPKAIDVNTREWLKWYKQNYKDDYLTLSPDVKIYWNNYLNSIRNQYGNVNNIFSDLDAARFSQTEINVNATPVETVSNLLTNLTAPGSNAKYILYGGIGLLFVYLLTSNK
jgi:hypothetical protein